MRAYYVCVVINAEVRGQLSGVLSSVPNFIMGPEDQTQAAQLGLLPTGFKYPCLKGLQENMNVTVGNLRLISSV